MNTFKVRIEKKQFSHEPIPIESIHDIKTEKEARQICDEKQKEINSYLGDIRKAVVYNKNSREIYVSNLYKKINSK